MPAEPNDPDLLVRYLLGTLPEAEAERMDERSIADDDFAARLAEAENDLVDSYVRGELSGETLERFRTHYRSTDRRQRKVQFAEALRRRVEEGRSAPSNRVVPGARLSARRPFAAWALAAAALLLALPAGYLFVVNASLRRELADALSRRATLETRSEDLRRQLEEKASADLEARKQPPGASAEMIGRLKIVSALLLPQTRGANRVESVSLPPGTDLLALQLHLESDEFPRYEVALKSAGENRVLWRSGPLESAAANGRTTVTASVPANLLSPGHFSVELVGAAPGRPPELMASYAFRAAVR